MFPTQFGHRVVGDAGEIQTDIRPSDILDGRVGQRDDLPIVAEFVHLLETRVEVEELGNAAQPLADVF